MAIPTLAQLEKMSAAQQDKFFTGYFKTFKSTVTAAWAKNDPFLAPYEGDSALQMYQALRAAYPASTPLQRGATVYKAWLVNGLGSAVQKIVGADSAALGATATGIQTASYVPSWSDGLAELLANLASGALWIRVGEVALGLILVAVGLARVTSAVPVATRIAKTAGAVAI